MQQTLWVILAIAAIALVGVMWSYNALVALRERARNAWAQIDVQLRRRFDLVPNLVEAVRGYLKHEKETLVRVIEARNAAASAWRKARRAPEARAAADAIAANAMLGRVLVDLQAVMENYPDLKAERPVRELMEELATTENRIAFARQAYNDEATLYNTRIQRFPDLLIAQAFGFRPMPLWREEEAEAKQPVRISLS